MPFTKYSKKQKALARVAKPRNAITGADFAKLKKKKKNGKKNQNKESLKRYQRPRKVLLRNISQVQRTLRREKEK